MEGLFQFAWCGLTATLHVIDKDLNVHTPCKCVQNHPKYVNLLFDDLATI